MKNTLVGITAVSLLAFSSSAIAGAKHYTPKEAEAQIMKECVEDPDNTEAQCVCVIDGLKTNLPEKDYDFMLNVITMAMNGNFAGMWDYAVENDITIFELKRFGEKMEEVSKQLDEDCDDPDVNFDIDI
jgi:hypothetical protein